MTYQHEGFRGLYKGFWPTWARMAPWSLTFWLTYEEIRKICGLSGFWCKCDEFWLNFYVIILNILNEYISLSDCLTNVRLYKSNLKLSVLLFVFYIALYVFLLAISRLLIMVEALSRVLFVYVFKIDLVFWSLFGFLVFSLFFLLLLLIVSFLI